jgi:hypothetical protein
LSKIFGLKEDNTKKEAPKRETPTSFYNEIYKNKAKRLMLQGVVAYNRLQSRYEMANVLEGEGNLHIGPENAEHNYYILLDAAYELDKTNPEYNVPKAIEEGLKSLIEEYRQIIPAMNVIIAQMEREKANKAGFKLPCKELLADMKNTINSLTEVEHFLCNFQNICKYLKLYNLLK